MKKKIIYIILALALLLAPPVYAGTHDDQLKSYFERSIFSMTDDEIKTMVELVRKATNDELRSLTFGTDFYSEKVSGGDRLNQDNYLEYEVLAYGGRFGTYDRDIDEHRYLGLTALEEAYTNTYFRPDYPDGVQIDQADWIFKPVKNDEVIDFVLNKMGEYKELMPSDFDYQEKYRDTILLGFEILNGERPDYYKLNIRNALNKDWENYIHILQPPSGHCWGTGRMFRKLPGGSIRYMDVPLVSFYDLIYDLSVKLKEEHFQGPPGQVIESTAAFELNEDCVVAKEAKLRLYMKTPDGEIELPFTPTDPAKKLDGNRYIFKPGEKLEVKFSFTVPGAPAEIVARIDRATKKRHWIERNMANNEDRAPILGLYDVSVRVAPTRPSFTSFNGGKTPVTFKITVGRKDDIPGEIETTGTITGPTGAHPLRLKLGPGEYKVLDYGFPGTPGNYTVEADSWPPGTDAHPPDNRDSVTVTVGNQVLNFDSKIRGDIIDD